MIAVRCLGRGAYQLWLRFRYYALGDPIGDRIDRGSNNP